jgi:glycine hydroxymethyltransferase
MKEAEMKKLAAWINTVISNYQDKKVLAQVKNEVKEMCLTFPVPGIN